MINTPEQNIESLTGFIDNLKIQKLSLENTVTSLEAEVARLKGMVDAESYTISEMSKQKFELEGTIATLESQKEKGTLSLKNLQESIAIAKDNLSAIDKSNAEARANQAEFEEYLKSEQTLIENKKADLINLKESVAKREQEVVGQEERISDIFLELEKVKTLI